jgi:uncharacterized protein YndB with AHSA1/START domain
MGQYQQRRAAAAHLSSFLSDNVIFRRHLARRPGRPRAAAGAHFPMEAQMPYTYTLTTVIPAAPQEVYRAWLDSEAHSEMTGGEASMSGEVGAEVSAWDGYITGSNLELVPGERIVQSWRTGEFTDEHEDSIVTVMLEPVDEGTLLTLIHSNVPNEHTSYEEGGWESQYFEPMKAYFAGLEREDAAGAEPSEPAPSEAAPPAPEPQCATAEAAPAPPPKVVGAKTKIKRTAPRRSGSKRAAPKKAAPKKAARKKAAPKKRAAKKRAAKKRAAKKRAANKRPAKKVAPKRAASKRKSRSGKRVRR